MKGASLADSIVMIHHGRIVLNGARTEIQRQYSDGAVLLDPHTSIDGMSSVARSELVGEHRKITLAENRTPKDFLVEMLAADRVCQHFELAVTPLEDIFIRLVQETRV